MLYKVILISLLLGSVNSKAEDFKHPMIFEMYKIVYITQINKEANQITTKESLSGGKPKVYNYKDNSKNYFFETNLKKVKLNKKYQILVTYEPDYDKNGNPLQNAQVYYEKDENGILIAVCEGQCKI